MKDKNFLLRLCVGLSILSCFVLTLVSYLQTRKPISLAAFIVCSIGFVVFTIAFIVETIRSEKNKK